MGEKRAHRPVHVPRGSRKVWRQRKTNIGLWPLGPLGLRELESLKGKEGMSAVYDTRDDLAGFQLGLRVHSLALSIDFELVPT